MAFITKIQEVLNGLQQKISGRAEDAYRDRDEAGVSGQRDAENYAAGEAHAYSEDEDAVRDAQDEAGN